MQKKNLKVEKRKLVGRKLKQLRRQGLLPANIFGKKIKSLAVQLSLREFEKVFSAVSETGIVELTVDKEKKVRPVLITNVQHHPITKSVIHADFNQVSLTEKVQTSVPIKIIGESPAVEQKTGVLLRLMDEVEVKALPSDLPEHIDVDIATLSQVDEEIKVKDLSVDKTKIELLEDAEQVVVKIGPLVTREVEEQVKEEEKAAEEAKAEVKEEVEEKPAEKKEAKKESVEESLFPAQS